MKLTTTKRPAERKGDTKRLRREGMVPAVLYVRGQPSETITVPKADFDKILRTVQKGRLSTTKIALIGEHGKARPAILKDIQYHPTTYDVIHLDFEELLDKVKINVNVPIECTGVADCQGVKLGGVLRQVIRNLRVQCLPKDMPEVFELDVKAMNLADAKKLNELAVSKAVRPLQDLNEVCVVIAKR